MFECGLKIMDKSEQSSNESAISPGSVYGRIMALTREAFGHSVHPHLFRDSAATSIACEDPAHVYITKSILGHSTLRTSERHYNHAQSLEATRCYQARILELREPARAGHDRARRKRSLKEEPMRAVIYARYSTESQREASLADQLEVCRRYIERQGWRLVGSYEDAAVSGASRFRAGLVRLTTDAEANRFRSGGLRVHRPAWSQAR
jgi:hypothetical protein